MNCDQSKDGNKSDDLKFDMHETWQKYYVEHPMFDEKTEGLLERLVKISAVEQNLAENGKQTGEQLFESLKDDAVKADKECEFKSVEELDAFCKMHAPIFLYSHNGKMFRNSCRAYRKFCQFLCIELENGTKVNEDSIDEIVAEFVATLAPSERGSERCFVQNEVFADFKSLKSLSVEMPRGFMFDPTTRELSLASTHHKLDTLHWPIMADTYDVTKETSVDKSRDLLVKAAVVLGRPETRTVCKVIDGHFRDCTVDIPFSTEWEEEEEEVLQRLRTKCVYFYCWPRSADAKLEAFAISGTHDESMWTKAERLTMYDSAVGLFDN